MLVFNVEWLVIVKVSVLFSNCL